MSDTGAMGERVEAAAKRIYEAMKWAGDNSCTDVHPAWEDGGNSLAQDEARRTAHAVLFLSPTNAGEADYQSWKATNPDSQPDGTREALATCARMLEEYGPDCFPANDQGQVTFARSMMDATASEIRAFLAHSDETAKLVEALIAVGRKLMAIEDTVPIAKEAQRIVLAALAKEPFNG